MKLFFKHILLSALLTMTFFSLSQAGEVDVPNTFQSGSPAIAAEVNENFAAIETAVDDNAVDIEANTSAINANATYISTNAAATTANAAAINANATGISTNATTITANAGTINDHEGLIVENAEDLIDHEQSISTHDGRLPVAYGYVNPYALTTIYGTSNVSTVEWNAAYERYEITIDDFYFLHNDIAFAIVHGDTPSIIQVSSVSGKLLVYILDLDGNPLQNRAFNWSVYRY